MTITIETIQTATCNEQTHPAMLQGKAFCVTGKLEKYTREQVWEAIRNHGGVVCKTVQSSTDYVITGTIRNGFDKAGSRSLKLAKAEARGIQIIDEKEFDQMLIGA